MKVKIKHIFQGVFLSLVLIVPWSGDYFFSRTSAESNQIIFDEEVVWDLDNAPIAINGDDYYFNQGLKIEEGVEILLKNGASLIVRGKFKIFGSEDHPVVFRGADDGNNFSVSILEAEEVSIDYATFQKGGYNQCVAWKENSLFQNAFAYYIGDCLTSAALNIKDSDNIAIYHSTFQDNYKAINIIDSTDVDLEENYFLHDEVMAIYAETEESVFTQGNCWMRPSGPEYEGNPDGKGEKIVGDFNISYPKECGSDFKPVILIPGIGGSWNWSEMLAETEAFDDWDFTIGVNVYDAWEESLEDLGYKENRDYFIVYYDWRDDNKESLENYLLPVLEEIKEISYDESFDIIAHSMGGFMTLDYLTRDDYQDDIDKVVLQGTPLFGSNKVYKAWEGGVVPEGWEALENYIKLLSWKESEESSGYYDLIHKYIPSAEQLLPIYNYLEKDGELINYWEMEEQNEYLAQLMPQLFNNQNSFDFENNLLMIQGTGIETSEKILVEDYEGNDSDKLWKDGEIISEEYTDEGDGTVLNISSGSLPLFETVTLEDVDHGSLPAKAVAKTGEFLGIEFEDKDYTPESIKDKLLFLFACPIDVKITDLSGNYITKDESQIEGAYYYSDGLDDGYKIVEIQNPSDDEYLIEIIGNGEGEYNAIVYNYIDDKNYSAEFNGEVSEDEEISYQVNLDQENISLTEIEDDSGDEEGDCDKDRDKERNQTHSKVRDKERDNLYPDNTHKGEVVDNKFNFKKDNKQEVSENMPNNKNDNKNKQPIRNFFRKIFRWFVRR